jgi:hypothetical protein
MKLTETQHNLTNDPLAYHIRLAISTVLRADGNTDRALAFLAALLQTTADKLPLVKEVYIAEINEWLDEEGLTGDKEAARVAAHPFGGRNNVS